MDLSYLPTTVSNFKEIRQNEYLYIDKTKFVAELVSKPKGAYFCARPRRFGKSLFVSTLEEFFRGNKELFEGLYLHAQDCDWHHYPVLHINLGTMAVGSVAELHQELAAYVDRLAITEGVQLATTTPWGKLEELIRQLSDTVNKVVILIDEYDKPIISNLSKPELAQEIRNSLRRFYSVIKTADSHIRFSFLTGVSRFSKAGVFSDLNHLVDITFSNQFAAAFGVTEKELHDCLPDYVELLAAEESQSVDQTYKKLKHWYNGFTFSAKGEKVYNPFSTFNALEQKRYNNFWFESGTPSFLVELLKQGKYDVTRLNGLRVSEGNLGSFELDSLPAITLLYQTGYLTIKGYNSADNIYSLGFPNYEVESSFLGFLFEDLGQLGSGVGIDYLQRLKSALTLGDLDTFFTILKTLLSTIEYDLHLKSEKYYQTIFYLICSLLSLRVSTEVKTNSGRIDAVVELADVIYIFEFKIDKSVAEALTQIRERKYMDRFALSQKSIILVGVNFDTSLKQISDWGHQKLTVT